MLNEEEGVRPGGDSLWALGVRQGERAGGLPPLARFWYPAPPSPQLCLKPFLSPLCPVHTHPLHQRLLRKDPKDWRHSGPDTRSYFWFALWGLPGPSGVQTASGTQVLRSLTQPPYTDTALCISPAVTTCQDLGCTIRT